MDFSIKSVRDTESMLKYCNYHLGWNLSDEYFDDIDDLTYDFSASDLGIKEEDFAKVNSFKEMRPLEEKQEWGIFIVEFEGKSLPVTALRRILGALVPKKSNRNRHTWKCSNIFFMCLWGERNYRTIGFSAFEDDEKNLPVLKLIYCTPSIENSQQLHTFEDRILFLKCSPGEKFIDKLKCWHSVFQTRGSVIHDTKSLIRKLAKAAIDIRTNLENEYSVENANGFVNTLYERINKAMNLDLSVQDFMSMYAQTIVYGLFTARCMHPQPGVFSLTVAMASIPPTNPLLRELLKECCCINNNNNINFDELDILSVVRVLNDVDLGDILADFNRQTGYGKEDPIGYFYEEFLDIFEKEKKKRCGVYYTPSSVVAFIISSVFWLLKEKLGYVSGFYDNRVCVLDPAVGTGNFLRLIILDTYDEFCKNYTGSMDDLNNKWNEYLSANLLPRLIGFEFMISAYAVAHMKLAMTLKDTGYRFSKHQRINVFLVNSLIECSKDDSVDPLKYETYSAALALSSGINVILGGPPYHADSKNQSSWIMDLMEDYKKEPGTNERLKEKNFKLVNDDYVKFVRLAQHILEPQKKAINAFVIPFSYASSLTFRGMRWSLLNYYSEIYILNLHGNVMGRDSTDADNDENIFDIQLGNCITFFVKNDKKNGDIARVYYADFTGTREDKYRFLLQNSIDSIKWNKIEPTAPNYFFNPVNFAYKDEYEKGLSLSELFPEYLGGIKTHDDEHLVSMKKYDTKFDYLYDYRPFDIRHINYDRSKVKRDRYNIMRHMIGHKNYGLVIDRQVKTDNWSHIQIVRNMIDNRLHYSNRGIPVLCPMFLYEDDRVRANINRALVKKFEVATKLHFSERLTDQTTEFDMLDLFNYVYAILNSPSYRSKYMECLKIDFPKVPLPVSLEAFRDLCSLGDKLRKLHLLDIPVDNHLNISFEGAGDDIIKQKRLTKGRLFINESQYFTNISPRIWDFCFGGYHSLQKWFKDRKGYRLTKDDIDHIITVFNVFDNTLDLQKESDAILSYYGMIAARV